jgi:hypothetical protein
MAMDFPSSPTVGAIYTPAGGPSYRWDGTLWMPQVGGGGVTFAQQRRNRIVNPSMQVSQEFGDTSSGNLAGATYVFADQWQMAWSLTGGLASTRRTRFGPSGSDLLELAIVTGVASLGATNYVQLFLTIEGEQVRDFRWGNADAKRVVMRFLFYATLAGTYTACIRNFATDRSFLAPFTVAAATWTEVIIPVPGDVTGTWPTANAGSLLAGVIMAAGANYVGVAGWQAGHKMILPGTTNGAVTGTSFYATDFGLYLDLDGTGVPPRFETPDIADEMLRCQRYYQRHSSVLIPSGYTAAGAPFYYTLIIPAMRTTPVVTLSGAAYSNASGAALNVANPTILRLSAIMTAAGGGWADVVASLNARP